MALSCTSVVRLLLAGPSGAAGLVPEDLRADPPDGGASGGPATRRVTVLFLSLSENGFVNAQG